MTPSLSRRLSALCAAIVVTVGVVSAVVNAIRAEEYGETTEAFVAPSVVPIRNDVALVRTLLHDPLLEQQIAGMLGGRIDASEVAERVDVAPTPRSVAVTVRDRTPQLARDFVNALAYALASASARWAEAQGRAELVRVQSVLDQKPPPERRAALLRRARALREVADGSPEVLAFGPRPDEAQLDNWADRWLDRLPGPFPPRHDPLWAGLAGLLAGVTLCAALLVYKHSRVRA